ncbi:MAG: hypothetical protein FWD91_03555 [Treponema sp.]|nr:hypothetical protein [Treponema sp.]
MKLQCAARLATATVFFVLVMGVSCASNQVIPEGLTQMEMIQRGQEAAFRNKFPLALSYYSTLIERFPNDMYHITAAEYEIAFIHYKRRDFGTARTRFEALLARYEGRDAALLPPQFKVLSEIVLQRITEAEARRSR